MLRHAALTYALTAVAMIISSLLLLN
jgi:hypothetical protein